MDTGIKLAHARDIATKVAPLIRKRPQVARRQFTQRQTGAFGKLPQLLRTGRAAPASRKTRRTAREATRKPARRPAAEARRP